MSAHMSPNGRFIWVLFGQSSEGLRAKVLQARGDVVVRKTGDSSDAEGLRLMQAFFHITEPDRRREVIELAERLVKRSPPRALAAPLAQDNESTK